MLRSIVIGFAIAALLQLGVHSAASTADVSLAAFRTASLECQAAALGHWLAQGLHVVTR